jgi:hypothetical protein
VDRISGKSNVDYTTMNVVGNNGVLGDERSLEDRKLDHVQLKNGKEPQSQSSVSSHLPKSSRLRALSLTAHFSSLSLPPSQTLCQIDQQIYLTIPRTHPREERCVQPCRVPAHTLREETKTHKRGALSGCHCFY